MARTKPAFLEPLYELEVCPWTPGNPRHDHQLIFPLSDGRLLLVWSEYYADRPSHVRRTAADLAGTSGGVHDDFPCRLSGKTSCDSGRNWSATFTVQENLWGYNVKHPNLLRLPSGDVVLTFTAWESDAQRNIYMKRSGDDGETWGPITRISEPGWYCTNNDHVLRTRTGRIILPGHGGPGFEFKPGNPLHSFVLYSDDDGLTWRMSRTTMTAPGRGAHEPAIVELQDGRLLCFLRTTCKCIYKSLSNDGGETWSEPAPTELPAPDSPPLLKRLPGSGNLLCLWNNVPSESNWPRNPLTAAVSVDEGETWGNFQDIDNRTGHDAAYAAVLFHGDEALVTYYTRKSDGARDASVLLKIYKTKQFDIGSRTDATPKTAGRSADDKFDLSRVRSEALGHAETLHVSSGGIGGYRTPQSPEPSMYASCDAAIMRTIMGEDLLKTLNEAQRREWIAHINSFALPDGNYQRYRHHSPEHANGMVIGALGVLGGRQKYPVQLYRGFDTPDKARLWLENIDWQDQWSGSHLFWGGMHCFSMTSRCAEDWRGAVFDWLDAELDPQTGWWRRGVPAAQWLPGLQPLGGAAHIWPIYQHHHHRFPLPERVIDSILSLQKPDGSWLQYGNYMDMDALYGLAYMSSLAPHYRRQHILAAAHEHGRGLVNAWPLFLAGNPDLHLLLGAVGAFGLLNQLLPDIYHDTLSWTDIFSDKRLYRTEDVNALNTPQTHTDGFRK